eukprot:m.49881 g.49881  ORF g.49881 m.49881 type:complete len:834 (-) comp12109_c0_seq2:154-2655(-)
MGSLWRSQEMSLQQIFLSSEAAYECVSALGELDGCLQFRDLNPDVNAFQRKFVNDVRRTDELERQLRFFEKELNKAKIPFIDMEELSMTPAPNSSEIQSMESQFSQLERELNEINVNEETLKRQELELNELREILRQSGHLFEEAELQQPRAAPVRERDEEAASLLDAPGGSSDRGQLGFVTGVIARAKVAGFERVLWRASRGNAFLRHLPVNVSDDDDDLKNIFIVFFQGGQLEQISRKICDGFEATLYPCPAKPTERLEVSAQVDTRLTQLTQVLDRTSEHRRAVLSNIAVKLGAWQVRVHKVKAIYHVMNMFKNDVTRKCLIAECWCPVKKLGTIRAALQEGTERSGSNVPAILNPVLTKEKPPTYHMTNKFTDGFQAIVDAYGVASYREVNPGPFTIITFPFLFAVMFGDLGHGTLMALAAFFLIYKEDSLKNFKGGGEIWQTMFGGRYIIFLMGLFSMYTGLIYNDIFSKSMTLFSSGWNIPSEEELNNRSPPGSLTLDDFDRPYELGVDPIWAVTTNKLTFTNSFKMKLSVLLGISQMTFGVVLSLFNHRFFKKPLNIYTEFIPQVLFLMCIFGYLCAMIVYKWLSSEFPNGNPPSLLLMLINMFLKFGSPIEPSEVLYGDKAGNTQKSFQMALVVIAIICVPWMLFVKPFMLKAQHKAKTAGRPRAVQYQRTAIDSEGSQASDDAVHVHLDDEDDPLLDDEEEHFEFGEVFVHQCIHTIEYCLGAISNTASYLRLWALSLAHAQLSEVLWEMVLHNGFKSFYLLYAAFTVWAVLTIAVLLIMEGLSAFLHALRLHWVEFQNKFYEGTGYKFAPFSFRRILAGQTDD